MHRKRTMRSPTPPRLTAVAVLAAAAAVSFAGAFHPLSPSWTLAADRRRSSSSSLSMSFGGGDMAGKVAYQRFLYRLSPLSDCPETPYTVEERLRFRVTSDGRTLEPFGGRTYILRDGPPEDDGAAAPEERKPDGGRRTYMRVGKALYKLHVRAGDGEEEETSEDSCVASALYLAARPELVRGTALELGSGSGLGGILGCVAAGVAVSAAVAEDRGDASEAVEEDAEGDEEVLPHHEAAPLPPDFEKIVLADPSEEALEHAFHNCKNSGLPPSAVELAVFDIRGRVPSDRRNAYDLILGNDIAYQFPDVKHIARTVAYTMKPSPYAGQLGEIGGGRFLHVGPHNRDTISELRRKLRRGYRMDTDVAYLELIRYDLAPMILDSERDEDKSEEDLLAPLAEDGSGGGQNGFVEYQNEVDAKYTGFVANHHMDYDGFNGEYFFPVETGLEEDGAPSRWVGEGNVERDDGYRKTDEGRGSWYFEE